MILAYLGMHRASEDRGGGRVDADGGRCRAFFCWRRCRRAWRCRIARRIGKKFCLAMRAAKIVRAREEIGEMRRLRIDGHAANRIVYCRAGLRPLSSMLSIGMAMGCMMAIATTRLIVLCVFLHGDSLSHRVALEQKRDQWVFYYGDGEIQPTMRINRLVSHDRRQTASGLRACRHVPGLGKRKTIRPRAQDLIVNPPGWPTFAADQSFEKWWNGASYPAGI